MVRQTRGTAVALLLVCPAAAANAQDRYEYEPDEGIHEEEWYDPSDWFDDDARVGEGDDVDYESDEYDADRYYDDYYDATDLEYGYHYDEYDEEYEYGWHEDDAGYNYDEAGRAMEPTTGAIDYDAYYDGYYDGYYDTDFGFDHWEADWDPDYAESYTLGYYDGFYDAEQDYDYEPYYYVTTYVLDREAETDRRRARDDRQRGDRGERRERMDRGTRPSPQMVRRRGTVERISRIDPDAIGDDHMVLKLAMADGATVRADFGPEMTRDRLPFASGDRLTLRGEKRTHDDTSYLVVQQVRSGDKEITLRPEPRAREDDRMERDRRRPPREEGDRRVRRVSFTGTVERVDQAPRDIRGYRLYRVRMQEGPTRILALDGEQRDKLRMKRGDRVKVEGRRMLLNERRVVDVVRIRGKSADETSGEENEKSAESGNSQKKKPDA